MAEPDVRPFQRRGWSPLPDEGCVDVEGRVVVAQGGLLVALLRFGAHATIHEHAGTTDTLVACLEGEGFTSVAGVAASISAGERVRWPRGVAHRLWTDGSPMLTLMVEQASAS
jgi:quercetin dioxygenase-like cupin family protein